MSNTQTINLITLILLIISLCIVIFTTVRSILTHRRIKKELKILEYGNPIPKDKYGNSFRPKTIFELDNMIYGRIMKEENNATDKPSLLLSNYDINEQMSIDNVAGAPEGGAE